MSTEPTDEELAEGLLREIERVAGPDHGFVVTVVNGMAVMSGPNPLPKEFGLK